MTLPRRVEPARVADRPLAAAEFDGVDVDRLAVEGRDIPRQVELVEAAADWLKVARGSGPAEERHNAWRAEQRQLRRRVQRAQRQRDNERGRSRQRSRRTRHEPGAEKRECGGACGAHARAQLRRAAAGARTGGDGVAKCRAESCSHRRGHGERQTPACALSLHACSGNAAQGASRSSRRVVRRKRGSAPLSSARAGLSVALQRVGAACSSHACAPASCAPAAAAPWRHTPPPAR